MVDHIKLGCFEGKITVFDRFHFLFTFRVIRCPLVDLPGWGGGYEWEGMQLSKGEQY